MQSDFLQIPPDTYRYYYQVQQILFKIPFCFGIWHKSDMKSFFLCNGNETQEIVKPTGEHDFCFRRFIGMVCTRKPGIFDLCRAPTIRSKYYKVSCRPLSNLSNNSFWYSLSKVPCRSFGYASSCSCCQLSFSLLTTIG